MTHTRTRTHVYIPYANPYLRCSGCGSWVTGWHDPEKCGCETLEVNSPCCCRLGVEDVCPSWSPVDGCTCKVGAHDRPPLASLPREGMDSPVRIADCLPDVMLDLVNRVRRGAW